MTLRRDAAPLVLAGVAAGVVLGVLVTAVSSDAYRATALVQIAPAVDPRQPSQDASPVAADVLAESYARLVDSRAFLAQLAPRVANGELDAAELDERVRAKRPAGSSLVEVTATRSSRGEAERLAGEVANALVTLVRQLEEQRALRVETALRGRMDELQAAIRRARDETRLETLRAERLALATRLADAVAGKQGSVVQIVGPGQSAEQVRPHLLRNLLGGALLGLVAALAYALLGDRRPEPVGEAPPGRAPEPTPVPEPQPEPMPVAPSVALAEPVPEAVLSGIVRLSADASPDVEQVQFLISNGSPDWSPVADAPPRLRTATWDTTSTADGGYWLCAVARNDAGLRTPSDPVPVAIVNGS